MYYLNPALQGGHYLWHQILLGLCNLHRARVTGNGGAKFWIQVLQAKERKKGSSFSIGTWEKKQMSWEGREKPTAILWGVHPRDTKWASLLGHGKASDPFDPTTWALWWVEIRGLFLNIDVSFSQRGNTTGILIWGILIWKVCLDDLALILYHRENTRNIHNILYDPLRIFLLQLLVTALER